MIKVKALREFYDRENNLKLRKKDEEFEVSEKRAEKLTGLGYVKMAEKATEKAQEKKG
ncbi:MAG: hypothetical protein J6B94_08585 [Lachnospiraceae bacterium]|nr:hypothetical protein [Lachnospiraceae bacterium]